MKSLRECNRRQFAPRLTRIAQTIMKFESVPSWRECSSIYVLSLFYIQIWILFSRQPAALDGWNEWMYKWICFGMACLSSAPASPLLHTPTPSLTSPGSAVSVLVNAWKQHILLQELISSIQLVAFVPRTKKGWKYVRDKKKNLKFLMLRVCFFLQPLRFFADIYNKHAVN